jgi:WXG100 family type VII secretion target
MSKPDLDVPFDALERAGDNLIASAGTLADRLAAFDKELQAIKPGWVGEASDQFYVQIAAWFEDAGVVAAELEAIGNILRASRNRYYRVELDVRDAWSTP